MSNSTCKDEPTTGDRGSSSADTAGDAEQTPQLGHFRPWGPVARLIQTRFKGTTQLIAFQLARHTQRDGICHMTGPLMSEITGYHEDTCRQAMADVVKAGLVTAKKTRDGYVYTWSRDAYTGAGVALRPGKSSFS